MRSMRRGYQQVSDMATLERWLDEALVGRLATVDQNGYPVIKPVNFVYSGGKIVFHSAREGEKLDDMRRDPRVGFEMDRFFAVTPPPGPGCGTHCFYQSIIIRGKAHILDGPADRAKKELGLRLLIAKYSPSFGESPLSSADETTVVEIDVEQITGKEDFGQKWSPERKLAVARRLFERDREAATEAILRMGLTLEQVLGALAE